MIEGEQIPTILAVCAMIATFAIVLLAVCAVAVLLSVRKANARLMEFVDRWQPVAESAQQTVADFAEHSGELLSRLNQLTAVLHKQTLQLDSMLSRLLATAPGQCRRCRRDRAEDFGSGQLDGRGSGAVRAGAQEEAARLGRWHERGHAAAV